MNRQVQLLMEIEENLRNNDIELVKILLAGENDEQLQKIKKGLPKDRRLKAKFDRVVKQMKIQQQKSKENDKIRKINAEQNVSDEESSENVVTVQLKKRAKAIKIDQMFGYTFYGQVKCLMVAYGDLNPLEQSIKMMHSQIQTLKFQIFKRLDEQFSKPAKMKHYLSEIFPQQFSNYFSIKKVYKSATANAKANQKSIEQSDESLNALSSDDDDNADGVAIDHMVITTKQQKEYFINLTADMDGNQYQSYSQCRSINFLPNKNSPMKQKKFINFLDPDNRFSAYSFDLELISFLLCRTVRKIIFRIIRSRYNGKLQKILKSLTVEEIKQQGNEIISEYQMACSLYLTSPEQEAQVIFVDQFASQNYRQILPKNVVLHRRTAEDAINIWKENKIYQKMWTERILAEKEIDEHYDKINAGQIDSNYQYSRFILRHYQKYREMGKAFLWKKYFLQENPQQNQNSAKGGPRKQMKLESIKK